MDLAIEQLRFARGGRMILDIDQHFADSYPVVVSDTLTLEEGDTKQFDSQALSNIFSSPMVIDEVRVQIVAPLDLQVGNFGGSVRLKLSLGRYALSSVFIPVGCLGTSFGGGELGTNGFDPQLFSPESIYGGFTEVNSTGFFRWKLPRPLLCPIGMPLEAIVSRQIEGLSNVFPGADPLTVNLSYAGRVTTQPLPPGDITAPIPYVGLYENVFTSASVSISNQTDLYNPFQGPLNVQRLIGRWQNIYLDSSVETDSWIGLDQRELGGSEAILFPSTQVKTFSGFYITNGFIPGQALFDADTRSLPMNILLDRGEGLEVTIDATAGIPTTGAQPSPTGSNTSFVTMIGWRNETL